MTLEEKLDLAEQKTSNADDYREIFNVISAQTFYIRVQKQQDAFDVCWSKREDVSFGGAKGRQAVIDYFINESTKDKERKLRIANKYHGVAINSDNSGVGDLDSIGAASPYIVVANDRQTAQGVWFTPQVKSELGENGQLKARYIQQRIGVDFINEDGQWKIWHYNIYPDFTCALPSEIFDDNRYTGRTFHVDEAGGPDGSGGPGDAPNGHGGPPKGAERARMEPYSPTKVPYFNPPIPTPYETWTEDETLPMG